MNKLLIGSIVLNVALAGISAKWITSLSVDLGVAKFELKTALEDKEKAQKAGMAAQAKVLELSRELSDAKIKLGQSYGGTVTVGSN